MYLNHHDADCLCRLLLLHLPKHRDDLFCVLHRLHLRRPFHRDRYLTTHIHCIHFIISRFILFNLLCRKFCKILEPRLAIATTVFLSLDLEYLTTWCRKSKHDHEYTTDDSIYFNEGTLFCDLEVNIAETCMTSS